MSKVALKFPGPFCDIFYWAHDSQKSLIHGKFIISRNMYGLYK